MEDPILLEATMVRCAQNRAQSRYEAECISARDAVNRLAAVDQAARRKELEAQSKRKREALRRTQEARAEVRRRVAEAERLRKEAEYLGIFDETMEWHDGSVAGSAPANDVMSNAPIAQPEPLPPPSEDIQDPVDGQADANPGAGDLDAIREELRRRQESINQ